mmetsp:Transcript_52568/g.145755  ORF Transcript_52568/g.145755 Transcript_52568/m.145755 type:complete len:232 (+) Transcript_52568:980-1675(+)
MISGAVYPGLPHCIFMASASESLAASPKSESTGRPSWVSRMFPAFTSRCTRPRECRCTRAASRPSSSMQACLSLHGPCPRTDALRSHVHSSVSRTWYGRRSESCSCPSSSSWQNMPWKRRMLGWPCPWISRASSLSTLSISECLTRMTLAATQEPSPSSHGTPCCRRGRAMQTVEKPPDAMGRLRSSYRSSKSPRTTPMAPSFRSTALRSEALLSLPSNIRSQAPCTAGAS